MSLSRTSNCSSAIYCKIVLMYRPKDPEEIEGTILVKSSFLYILTDSMKLPKKLFTVKNFSILMKFSPVVSF